MFPGQQDQQGGMGLSGTHDVNCVLSLAMTGFALEV